MPSPRRLRLLLIAVLFTVVLILVYSSGLDSGRKDTRTFQDFYRSAMDGIKKGRGQAGSKKMRAWQDKDNDGDVDDDDLKITAAMQQRLKAAEQQAKEKANGKALRPDPPSHVVGKGSSAEGQDRKGSRHDSAASADGQEPPPETKEEHDAEIELGRILKQAPVIIFSKTYCPHSKEAKRVLLESYAIKPEPYIVELDKYQYGPQLQAKLLEKTGRKTVPNIMVNGVSMGGGDDILELDRQQTLADKIRSLGNKRVEINPRPKPAHDDS